MINLQILLPRSDMILAGYFTQLAIHKLLIVKSYEDEVIWDPYTIWDPFYEYDPYNPYDPNDHERITELLDRKNGTFLHTFADCKNKVASWVLLVLIAIAVAGVTAYKSRWIFLGIVAFVGSYTLNTVGYGLGVTTILCQRQVSLRYYFYSTIWRQ